MDIVVCKTLDKKIKVNIFQLESWSMERMKISDGGNDKLQENASEINSNVWPMNHLKYHLSKTEVWTLLRRNRLLEKC